MDEEEERQLHKKLGIPEPPPAVSALLNTFKKPPTSQTAKPVYFGNLRFLAMGFLIPFAFIAATLLQLTLATEAIARGLISIISLFWSFAAPNYEWIKVHSSEMAAINYAVFLGAVLIFFFAFVYISFKEIETIPKDRLPTFGNILTIAVIGVLIDFVFRYTELNGVKAVSRGRYDFVVDGYGIYYLQQYITLLAGNLYVFAVPFFLHRFSPWHKERE